MDRIDREQWERIERHESELNLAVFIFFAGLASLIVCAFFAVDLLIWWLK